MTFLKKLFMRSGKKVILVFGCGELQRSIIGRAHKMGLFVVGIDPCEDAFCRADVDAFEVIGGQDYEGTCSVVEEYGVDAIVTAATDKPLVMMARIASRYGFPFFSVDTACWSTDKYLMKQRFMEAGVPCAKGLLAGSSEEVEGFDYPVIVKPRDNSGSRGVKLCRTKEEVADAIAEAKDYSRLDSVLVEEFIEGREFSIEALHHSGGSEVIQFTEKKTTELPYNVELGHKQPADLTDEQKELIREIVKKAGAALGFTACPSHTELKINDRGIFVIETSPRLGGDYITSTLVPLSTGINMEDQLLHISLGEETDIRTGREDRASGICYLNLPCGEIKSISSEIVGVSSWPAVQAFESLLKAGDRVNPITSSLNRYGHLILQADDRKELDRLMDEYEKRINSYFSI